MNSAAVYSLSSAAAYSLFSILAAAEIETLGTIAKRRAVGLAIPLELQSASRNLRKINDVLEPMAIDTHATSSKVPVEALSNDDPAITKDLSLLITINGTMLSQSPSKKPAIESSTSSQATASSSSSLTVHNSLVPTAGHIASSYTVPSTGPSPETLRALKTSNPSLAPTSSDMPSSDRVFGEEDETTGGVTQKGDASKSIEPSPPPSVVTTQRVVQLSDETTGERTETGGTPTPTNQTGDITFAPMKLQLPTEAPTTASTSLDDDVTVESAPKLAPTHSPVAIITHEPAAETGQTNFSASFLVTTYLPSGEDQSISSPAAETLAAAPNPSPTGVPVKLTIGQGESSLSRHPSSLLTGGNNDYESKSMPSNAPMSIPSAIGTPISITPHDRDEQKDYQVSLSPTSWLASRKDIPTPHPTEKSHFYSPTWAGDKNEGTYNLIFVDLPRIICDMRLSSSLQYTFERTKVLITSMTTIIYDLFETHAHKHDLSGISLNVEVKRNPINNLNSTAVRFHAYFTGNASFSSKGAPNSKDLTSILIQHFSVDKFNRLLRQGPLKHPRARTSAAVPTENGEEFIKVHSVFITLEDGSLVLAGSASSFLGGDKLPLTTVARVGKGPKKIQISFVLVALAAMGSAMAMIIFLVYSIRRRNGEEDDGTAAYDNGPPIQEGQSRIAKRATEVEVEIEVPSTPHVAMSDVSEDNSDLSALEPPSTGATKIHPSSDFHCGASASTNAPTSTGIVGIAKPDHYRYDGEFYGFAGNQSWQQQRTSIECV